jgi:hypothetical protein
VELDALAQLKAGPGPQLKLALLDAGLQQEAERLTEQRA